MTRPVDYILKCSAGNDSTALIQWAHEHIPLKHVVVVHNNTGWGRADWAVRVATIVRPLAERYGFEWVTLESVGMEPLVKQKKGWPSQLSKFCTTCLKLEPYWLWLRQNWPTVKDATALCGVRRCESTDRANWPGYVEESEKDMGLPLWSPLAPMNDRARNDLLFRAGVAVLPTRSRECCPCVNFNKQDLLLLDESDIVKTERLEKIVGKPMFRAKKHKGAIGIRNIIKWAKGEEFKNDELDIPLLCDAGMCSD